MGEISRADFIEWLNSHCTQALLANLDSNCKVLMNTWAGRGYQTSDSAEATAIANAGALGVIEALTKSIEAIQSGTFTELSDDGA